MSTPINKHTVPEIWYRGQRVIRAILVAAPVWLIGLNLSLPLVAGAFNSPDVPPAVYGWVNGVVVVLLTVTGVLTRIIAIPAVNAFLTKLGAGSVPKSAIDGSAPPAK
jgi:hypothetical protein